MNNWIKLSRIIGCLAILSALNCLAQSAGSNEPPPQAPYIAKLPKKCRYTVRIDGASGGLTGEVITKLDDVKGIMVVFGGGKSKQFWVRDNFVFPPASGQARIAMVTQEAVKHSVVQLTSDEFNGFEWLSPGNYVGIVASDGKKCYAFANGTQQAWIDVATKFPVALKSGNVVSHFEFGGLLPDTAQWPAECEQAWQAGTAHIKAMSSNLGPR